MSQDTTVTAQEIADARAIGARWAKMQAEMGVRGRDADDPKTVASAVLGWNIMYRRLNLQELLVSDQFKFSNDVSTILQGDEELTIHSSR